MRPTRAHRSGVADTIWNPALCLSVVGPGAGPRRPAHSGAPYHRHSVRHPVRVSKAAITATVAIELIRTQVGERDHDLRKYPIASVG